MTTVQKSGKTSGSENMDPKEKGPRASNTPRYSPVFLQCADHKKGDPVFNVTGNITGMVDKRSPVSNMKMQYQGKKHGPPELNFDIDLVKESGEDEKFVLSNGPSEEEKERMMHARLCQLEQDLLKLKNQLEYVKILRKDWNNLKVGLCNRRFKDKPSCGCSKLEKDE